MLSEQLLSSQALFTEHAAFVWRVLRRLGVPEADVEDVCQEVFIAVHKQLPNFQGRSKPSTWIYAIARRRAASYRASARHRHEQPMDADGERTLHDVPEQDAHDGLERAQMRAQLDRLLDTLDDDKREVFVLYEIEELDMHEVVEIVGCPLQTGYGRLHAARARLRRGAEEAGIGP